MTEPHLTPRAIIDQLHRNRVTHVVWLPDTESSFLYQEIERDEALQIVPFCREGESMAIAAGLWAGGKRPIVMIQNTGLFESGDSMRGLSVDIDLPVVFIVGYRGWTRRGITKDSAAIITEPTLNAWRVNYYLVETDADAERISVAFEDAERNNRPVACLIGAEYG